MSVGDTFATTEVSCGGSGNRSGAGDTWFFDGVVEAFVVLLTGEAFDRRRVGVGAAIGVGLGLIGLSFGISRSEARGRRLDGDGWCSLPTVRSVASWCCDCGEEEVDMGTIFTTGLGDSGSGGVGTNEAFWVATGGVGMIG